MRISVKYQDALLGRLNDDTGQLLFQYDNDYLSRGVDLSPLYLPKQQGVIETKSPFEGNLPGLFADSLPDAWGGAIIDRRLREAGIAPESVSILKRLALIGTGGLGALTYHPEESENDYEFAGLQEALHFARTVMEEDAGALPGSRILQEAGSNPGGRFPKLLVGWNPESDRLLIGVRASFDGYLPCIMKLDMGDDESLFNRGLCANEHALLNAARVAEIDTPEHWLVEGEDDISGPFAHLVVQRFDRDGASRIHAHTFGGVTHQLAIRYGSSYEDLLRTTQALCNDHRQVVQQFRRMAFNVLSGNRDDHVRNHSFLFQETRGWTLSPAYDLTSTPTKPEHALSINSKWSTIEDSDLLAMADLFSIDGATQIIQQCRDCLNDQGMIG